MFIVLNMFAYNSSSEIRIFIPTTGSKLIYWMLLQNCGGEHRRYNRYQTSYIRHSSGMRMAIAMPKERIVHCYYDVIVTIVISTERHKHWEWNIA